MPKPLKLLLPTVLLVALPGCVFGVGRFNENEPLSETALAKLVPGKSTARDVVEILGAPANVRRLDHGRSAYFYSATNAKVTVLALILVGFRSDDTRQDRAWLFFDENDVLTHYGVTLAGHRAQVSLPWTDLHDPRDRAAADAERRARENTAPATGEPN